MSLVTPTQVNPNDDVNNTSVNTPINQLATVINGNLDDTNISGLSGTKIADATITPTKRTGGFKIGSVNAAVFTTTGSKSVIGVGFKPKLIRFTPLVTANTTVSAFGAGATDDQLNAFYVYTSSTAGNVARDSNINTTGTSIVVRSAGVNTPLFTASVTSMDTDGFTVNVTTAQVGNTIPVAYEAYA